MECDHSKCLGKINHKTFFFEEIFRLLGLEESLVSVEICEGNSIDS